MDFELPDLENDVAKTTGFFGVYFSQRLAQLYEDNKQKIDFLCYAPGNGAHRKLAWIRITNQLNDEGGNFTPGQVKKRWSNMKRTVKVKLVAAKRVSKLTGEGPSYQPALTAIDKAVLQAIGNTKHTGGESQHVQTTMCTNPATLNELRLREGTRTSAKASTSVASAVTASSRRSFSATPVGEKSNLVNLKRPDKRSQANTSTKHRMDLLALRRRALLQQIESSEAMIRACDALMQTCKNLNVVINDMQVYFGGQKQVQFQPTVNEEKYEILDL